VTGPEPPQGSNAEPLLRVVQGSPTDEEGAALAVVVAAKLAARPAQRPDRRPAGGWADRARAMRAPLAPGPGAWRRTL
jgi:acyl-CoA carboxylase epsilon subunit